MKTVGIIAEYNPFHNGHAYHIQKAKEISGADCAVIVMSGNFVQRGTPAILNKETRAQMALLGGADLVLELPTLYSCASAEYFALGAVLTLEKLGLIDFLCFGSEEGNLPLLLQTANFLLQEPPQFKEKLASYLKQGNSFPKARAKAFAQSRIDVACQNNNDSNSFFEQPNNILGIEYLKTLKKYQCSLTPLTISRKNVHYHDKNLYQNFSSASAIRNAIQNQNVTPALSSLPTSSHALFLEQYQKSFPIFWNDFSSYFSFLFQREELPLSSFLDIKEELANRIHNYFHPDFSLDEFTAILKNKSLTYTAVQRALLHILLNIKQELLDEALNDQIIYYARILGMNKKGANLLKLLKKESALPLIQKPAKANSLLSPTGKKLFDLDITASHLYQLIQTQKFHLPFQNEYTKNCIRLFDLE